MTSLNDWTSSELAGNLLNCANVAANLPAGLKCSQETQRTCSDFTSATCLADFCTFDTACKRNCAENHNDVDNVCVPCSQTNPCVECTAGKQYTPDGLSCVDCDSSCTTCNGLSGDCELCPAGSAPNGAACSSCDENSFSLGTDQCKSCISETCTSCNSETGSCTNCVAGNGFDTTTGQCSACATNTWSSGQLNVCAPCVRPNFCAKCGPKANECTACSQGYQLSGNTCSPCDPGHYSEDGLVCLSCTLGNRCKACSSTDNSCTNCPAGKFINGTGCSDCPAGRFSLGGDVLSCTKCECKSSCDATTGECIQTPAHTADSGDSGNSFAPGSPLFIGVIIGGVGLIILIVVVVLLLTVLRKHHKVVEDRNIELQTRKNSSVSATRTQTVIKPSDLDVEITPYHLVFNGKLAEIDQQIGDSIVIRNNNSGPVEYEFLDLEEDERYEVELSSKSGTIPANDCVEETIHITLHCTMTLAFKLNLSLKRKKDTEPRVVAIDVALKGKASIKLDPTELTVGEMIGAGQFGEVHKGTFQNKDVAIKILKSQSKQVVDEFQREVDVLAQVRGKHVVLFYGAVFKKGSLCHVTEFMDLGSLSSVMEKNDLNTELKFKVMYDVCQGMEIIHSFGIIHRDLKPDNVLCCSPLDASNEAICKITDFGTSRNVIDSVSMTMTRAQGTPLYMAPEILEGEDHYTKSVDVYSFGILMVQVWNGGRIPFSELGNLTSLKLTNAIVAGKRPTLDGSCPEDLKAIIDHCCAHKSDDRPTFDALTPQIRALLDKCSADA